MFFSGSFAVDFEDHLRSILGIIYSLGIICGWGSFAVLYSCKKKAVIFNITGKIFRSEFKLGNQTIHVTESYV